MTKETTDPHPLMPRLLEIMDDTGWGGFVIRRRCHDFARVEALVTMGLVSSATAPDQGDDNWHLHLTSLGMQLRRELIRIAEAADV